MSKVGLFAAWVRMLSWKVALALAVKEGFEFIDGHPGALDFKSTAAFVGAIVAFVVSGVYETKPLPVSVSAKTK